MCNPSNPGRAVYGTVLLAALLSVAHAAIFVRMADAEPLAIAAYRMVIATAVVLPVALYLSRTEIRALASREWALIALGAVFLALHFATWIEGVARTSIANAVVLVTLTPVWLALWAVVALRKPPGARTWAAVVLAVAGSAVMAWGSFRIGFSSLLGDAYALAGGLFFAAFFLVAEAVRRSVGTLTFVVLVYTGAAVLLTGAVLLAGLPLGLSGGGYTGQTWFALIALGVISQVVGHSGFNWAVRMISPMVLALLLLTEPVLSAALGWLYFREGFGSETVIGGVLVLAAIYLGVRAEGAPDDPPTG